MTTLTIPRDRIRLDVQPFDLIVAIDGHRMKPGHEKVVHEQPFEMDGAVRLVNPLTETVHNLYPDTQVEHDITVERDETDYEAEEEAADEALTALLEDAQDAQEGLVAAVDDVFEAIDADTDEIAQETLRETLVEARATLATLPPMSEDEKRHVRRWSHYVEMCRVLDWHGAPTDLRRIYSTTHDDRGQRADNRRYSVAGTTSHVFGQIAGHHDWCHWVEAYTYRLTTSGRAAIAYLTVAPYDLAEQKIEALARAVHSGAANPGLIKRAEKIADTLDGLDQPDLAARLRVALTTKGESLGLRYERVMAILDEFRKVSR